MMSFLTVILAGGVSYLNGKYWNNVCAAMIKKAEEKIHETQQNIKQDTLHANDILKEDNMRANKILKEDTFRANEFLKEDTMRAQKDMMIFKVDILNQIKSERGKWENLDALKEHIDKFGEWKGSSMDVLAEQTMALLKLSEINTNSTQQTKILQMKELEGTVQEFKRRMEREYEKIVKESPEVDKVQVGKSVEMCRQATMSGISKMLENLKCMVARQGLRQLIRK